MPADIGPKARHIKHITPRGLRQSGAGIRGGFLTGPARSSAGDHGRAFINMVFGAAIAQCGQNASGAELQPLHEPVDYLAMGAAYRRT